jgi:type IV pilus assembly protein PilX
MFYSNVAFQRQKGFSLFVGMIFLIILSLLGVGLMRNNLTQEKMAMNSRDRQVAAFAAESALMDMSWYIYSSGNVDRDAGFSDNCANGLCNVVTNAAPIWVSLLTSDETWAKGFGSGNAVEYGVSGSTAIADVSQQPRFIVEPLGRVETSLVSKGYTASVMNYAYRGTVRGFGMVVNDDDEPVARVTLQAYYLK